MDFASVQFAGFFLLVLTFYWVLAPHRTLQKWLLLVSSGYFYATFSWLFLLLLVSVGLVDYVCGQNIACREKNDGRVSPYLVVGIALNLMTLGVFKYYNFFRENMDDLLALLGLQSHWPLLNIILPVGISFYTFQGIAYLIELHRGVGKPAKSPLDFLLFLCFFPQLLIGPICRSRELLPQIEAASPRIVESPSYAISLILSGLFKRMVLASLLFTRGVTETFYSPENYSSAGLWMAMIGYSIQIYCDFSGYTDLMRGFGLLFGFKIPENFRGPYAATSIGEFWRRWHITFGSWLRDFIYFPLGGSRRHPVRVYFNLLVTMLLCGIWHGASWGFVIWGTIHGFALVLHKARLDLSGALRIDPRRKRAWPFALTGWLWTFGICSFSRIFFYTPDLESATVFLKRMWQPSAPGSGFDLILLPVIALGLLMNFLGTPLRSRFVDLSVRLPWSGRWLFWVICLVVLFALRPHGIAPHVYFRF